MFGQVESGESGADSAADNMNASEGSNHKHGFTALFCNIIDISSARLPRCIAQRNQRNTKAKQNMPLSLDVLASSTLISQGAEAASSYAVLLLRFGIDSAP